MGDVLTKDEHHEFLTDAITATDPMGAEIAARKIDMHDAALRARVAELEGEVGRLTVQLAGCLTAAEGATSGDVVAHEGDYGWSVAYQATLDTRRRLDAALARAEKAEKERDHLRTDLALARRTPPDFDAFGVAAPCRGCGWIEGERKRATAAEAREAGLKAALNMMDECCWQAWKAFTEEGPNAAEKFLHDVCITEGIMNNDGGRIPRAALSATAKGKGEKP